MTSPRLTSGRILGRSFARNRNRVYIITSTQQRGATLYWSRLRCFTEEITSAQTFARESAARGTADSWATGDLQIESCIGSAFLSKAKRSVVGVREAGAWRNV
jgi:hypothetical protein